MMQPEYRDVDPRTLRLPGSDRLQGANPAKLHGQITSFGESSQGMPPIWVYRAIDGELIIYDGVTRATRIAKLCPGDTVRVQVIDDINTPGGHLPAVGDCIP